MSKTNLKKSIMAGILIGISSFMYLNIENSIIGSLIFSIGLISICTYNYSLFTGKCGYAKINDTKQLLLILFGNIVGTLIVSFLTVNYIDKNQIYTLCTIGNTEILVRSVICGVLMYLAVDGYKKHNSLLRIILCVMGFILSGCLHSIAISYHLWLELFSTFNISFSYFIKFLIIIIGNIIGSKIIYFINN